MRSAVGAFCMGPWGVARLFRFDFFFFAAEADGFDGKLAAVLDCREYGRAVAGAFGRPAGPFDVSAAGRDTATDARTSDTAIGSHLISSWSQSQLTFARGIPT